MSKKKKTISINIYETKAGLTVHVKKQSDKTLKVGKSGKKMFKAFLKELEGK